MLGIIWQIVKKLRILRKFVVGGKFEGAK